MIEYAQSSRIIQFNENEWKLSKCNCVEWKKFYKCNHVIAVAYLNKKIEWDVRAIESNRKKGRPTKAKSALSRQDAAALTQQIFSELNILSSLPLDSNLVLPIPTQLTVPTQLTEQVHPVEVASLKQKRKKKNDENVPTRRI